MPRHCTAVRRRAISLPQVREVYERAIANVPPAPEKRYWQRYIYLWVRYALWEELEAQDAERTREVYRACLGLIPHATFTFAKARTSHRLCPPVGAASPAGRAERPATQGEAARPCCGLWEAPQLLRHCTGSCWQGPRACALQLREKEAVTWGRDVDDMLGVLRGQVWIMAAQFEVRQLRLPAARKLLGTAIGMCPKAKLFKCAPCRSAASCLCPLAAPCADGACRNRCAVLHCWLIMRPSRETLLPGTSQLQPSSACTARALA